MKKMVLNIEGMHCSSCEKLIKDDLEELGVEKAEASHKKGNVAVLFDESKISLERIKKAIEDEGYKVRM